jgi:HEAT repeat protein
MNEVISIRTEVAEMARRMAIQENYDSAWMLGLEVQTFGEEGIAGLRYVVKEGTLLSRRAASFWLSDDAENVPSEIFLEMANDADPEVRFHAAYGLGYAKNPQAVPVLRRMMQYDDSPEVRQTATQSLYPAARLNGCADTIINDFAKALTHDPAPTVREEVATSLANFLKSPVKHKAIALLVKAIKDTDDMVRAQARISLSVLRNEVWDGEVAPQV